MTKPKKENLQSNKNTNLKNDKRKEFLKMLEDKILDFGQTLLKTGVSSLAISQINKTEEKIKEELEKKFKKYQKKIFKTLALLIALSFLFYGLLSLIMFKLNLSEYTNILFGTVFLGAYFLLNYKK